MDTIVKVIHIFLMIITKAKKLENKEITLLLRGTVFVIYFFAIKKQNLQILQIKYYG
jgi:hypothetical protein